MTSNLVVLKPSRMFRYKIMEHEGNTYIVDMLPHWYSVFWDLFSILYQPGFIRLKSLLNFIINQLGKRMVEAPELLWGSRYFLLWPQE